MKAWQILAAIAFALAVSGTAWAECGEEHAARTKTSAVQTPATTASSSHIA